MKTFLNNEMLPLIEKLALTEEEVQSRVLDELGCLGTYINSCSDGIPCILVKECKEKRFKNKVQERVDKII